MRQACKEFLLRDGWLPLVSLLATVAWIPALSEFAADWGLVCHPSGRRDHEAPTPLIGGVALMLGCLPVVAVCVPVYKQRVAMNLAAVLLLGVGLVDDRHDVRWRYRIAAQVLAGIILVYVGGVRIESIGSALGIAGHSLGFLSAPFTIIATVGLINALNMADGIDGLAGSLALAVLVMLITAALYAGNQRLALVLMITAGGVLGFLAFNLRTPWNPRARIFLGGGSEVLGLIIAWGCFRLTQRPDHPVTPVLAPFLIAPPVIDCLVVIARRLRSGRSPFAADKNHLHHLLLGAGLKTNQVVAVIVGVTLSIGLAAALMRRADVPEPLFPAIFLLLCAAYYFWSARRERRCAVLGEPAANSWRSPRPETVARPIADRGDSGA